MILSITGNMILISKIADVSRGSDAALSGIWTQRWVAMRAMYSLDKAIWNGRNARRAWTRLLTAEKYLLGP